MRRVILAVTGTIAGLVALLSFKSHVPSAPVAATTGGTGGTSSSSFVVFLGRRADRSRPRGVPAGVDSQEPAGGRDRRRREGGQHFLRPGPDPADQAGGKIVKVAVLVQPTNTLHDVQIGEFAFPKLISETLAAQNGKIDAVSGATYTSAGYIQSLQSALDKRS